MKPASLYLTGLCVGLGIFYLVVNPLLTLYLS